MSDSRPANRLIHEKSPYLLQHAKNPVAWLPYGEEAFRLARELQKPIFLSIGYSTCHWCHVMERESFEDPSTAAVMNELYVNIKVDREERPDVDHIYMQAVMALTGQGGWPLNVWLTPDLLPFYGGTYFPPDGRWGRPGFASVLRTLAEVFRGRQEEVVTSARRLVEALARSPASAEGLPEDLAARAAADLEAVFDARFGGFGSAPKFPRPAALAFLAHRTARQGWERGRAMLEKTLEMMWRGGLYDHVGGGFARYSTDDRWLVPHFEKMLYDNALLADAYLDGHLLLGREDFAEVVRDVFRFVAREMTHPQGGFYSAQDADSEGEEGRFYLFTLANLEEALGKDADRAAQWYGATAAGNFEGANILHWPLSVSETAAAEGLGEAELWRQHRSFRERLYSWREGRPRPGLDDKVLSAWNGLMIGALARAGAVLGEPAFLEAAEVAAHFLRKRLWQPDGTLLRRWREGEGRFQASLDDYASLGLGLLALFQATGKAAWLSWACQLLEQAEQRFGDIENGGYYFAAPAPDLILRLKDSYDGALPAANSQMALLLARLGACLGDEDLRERGRRTVRSFAAQLSRLPEGHPVMVMAWEELREPPGNLLIVGDGESKSFADLLRRAHCELKPGRMIVPVPHSERAALEALGVPLHGKTAPRNGAAAFLCEEAACRPW